MNPTPSQPERPEHNPDGLTPEQYGAPEWRLMRIGETPNTGDEVDYSSEGKTWRPIEGPFDGPINMRFVCAYRRRVATRTPAPDGSKQAESDHASPPDKCPVCGSPEVEANTPRTAYACGSSDYDQRPGTFIQQCSAPETNRPIPKALFPCKYCCDEYSWHADDLFWCESQKDWVCTNCWDQMDEEEERGVSLETAISQSLELRNAELTARIAELDREAQWATNERLRLKSIALQILKLAQPESGLQPGSQSHMRFQIKLKGSQINEFQDAILNEPLPSPKETL